MYVLQHTPRAFEVAESIFWNYLSIGVTCRSADSVKFACLIQYSFIFFSLFIRYFLTLENMETDIFEYFFCLLLLLLFVIITKLVTITCMVITTHSQAFTTDHEVTVVLECYFLMTTLILTVVAIAGLERIVITPYTLRIVVGFEGSACNSGIVFAPNLFRIHENLP